MLCVITYTNGHVLAWHWYPIPHDSKNLSCNECIWIVPGSVFSGD